MCAAESDTYCCKECHKTESTENKDKCYKCGDVCKSCLAFCETCEQEINYCKSHYIGGICGYCENDTCDGCHYGADCNTCGMVCEECSVSCHWCDFAYCREHSEIVACNSDSCDKEACWSHVDLYFDYCDYCGDLNFCEDCIHKCDVCETKICDEHTTECKVCLWRVCPDCVKDDCDICKGKVCNKHTLHKCALCVSDTEICEDCIVTCDACDKELCEEHTTECSVCLSDICSDCVEGTCDICKNNVCNKHTLHKCAGYVPTKKICEDCIATCDACDKKLYKKHTTECNVCFSDICSDCVEGTCDICKNKVCNEHTLHKCTACSPTREICDVCLVACNTCNKDLCEEHNTECKMCGAFMCPDCVKDVCDLCKGK